MTRRTWSTLIIICGGSGGITSTSGCVCTKIRVSLLSVSRRFSRASTASANRAFKSSDSEIRVQLEHFPQKSGRPSLTGGSRQFIAFASIKASVYFPEPLAPARIMACGKCARASMSRKRCTISALP